jgi:hypothetical protein
MRVHTVPSVSFRHLLRLTDDVGLFEHAEGTVPRQEHGYCVDDVARGLVAVCRAPAPAAELVALARRYLDFVVSAQAADGRFHNRLGYDRRWKDQPSAKDCWGRAVWGLGVAAASGPTPEVRTDALTAFERGVAVRSPWPHAMAFAALGAAAVLDVTPDHAEALSLLADTARVIGEPPADEDWAWPLPRLTYANAALAEAVICAGAKLGDPLLLDRGLRMLAWLLDRESSRGHLSVTPVGGLLPGDTGPGFDQQPIEAAAMADACRRAAAITGDERWLAGVQRCVQWFLGANDARISLLDQRSGGGCDGLSAATRNRNQGAESTIAAIWAMQHGHALARGHALALGRV